MSRIALVASALLTAVFVNAAVAQDLRLSEDINLFISPCGEPFEAPKKDAYPVVKWFNNADTNHDGRLTIEEMRTDADRFFKVLDRDGNGYIDGHEVTIYEFKIVPEILTPTGQLQTGIIKVMMQSPSAAVAPISPTGAAPGDENVYRERLNGTQGAVYYSLLREPEPVRSADRNFDYRITQKEFEEHSDRHFTALDTEKRGYLTLADLPKTDAEKAAKAHR
jgi:Ca2+-binding EF-hand superfamily protein